MIPSEMLSNFPLLTLRLKGNDHSISRNIQYMFMRGFRSTGR